MNNRTDREDDYYLFDKLVDFPTGRDYPPCKPFPSPPEPASKFYLPPGKSTNVSLWTEEDVRLWVGMFLKPSDHAETFRTLKELEIDGAVIEMIYEDKPAHTTLGFNLEDFEAIQAHAHEVFKVRIRDNHAAKEEAEIEHLRRREKTTDMSLWTEEDVRRWVAKFLKPSEHVETFRTLRELKIDGAVIQMIYEDKPAHTTMGINLEDYEAIQAHAHKFFNKNKAQDTSGI
ncbi:unnamed protein product [Caenorhabditis nigoni]